MEKFDEKEGRWITFRGRKIFIRSGESLGSAMSRSGKFGRDDRRVAKHEAKLEKGNKDVLDKHIDRFKGKNKKEAELKFKNTAQRYKSEWTKDYPSYGEPNRQAGKNRINENAKTQEEANTRTMRNYFKYSQEDRRELYHEALQKKLADYKAKKQSNNKIDDKQNDYTFTKTGGNNYFTTERVDKDGDMIGKIETHDRDVKKTYYVAWKPKDENLKYSPNAKWETQSFDTKAEALNYLKEKQSNNKIKDLKQKALNSKPNLYEQIHSVPTKEEMDYAIAKQSNNKYDVKYSDKDFVENWKNVDLDKANKIKEELGKYGDVSIEKAETIKNYVEKKKSNNKVNTNSIIERSGKVNQKTLKSYADDGLATDITRYSDKDIDKLEKKHGRLTHLKTSMGTYGMNGALLKSEKTGEYFVITARNSTLFRIV